MKVDRGRRIKYKRHRCTLPFYYIEVESPIILTTLITRIMTSAAALLEPYKYIL